VGAIFAKYNFIILVGACGGSVLWESWYEWRTSWRKQQKGCGTM